MIKFVDSKICKSREHCLNCRRSQGVRDGWKRKYEVPDDFDSVCAVGRSMEDVLQDNIRRVHAAQVQNFQPMPSQAEMAKNFIGSMKLVAKGLAAGRYPVVPDDVLEERVAICKSNVCGKFDSKRARCTKCGCKGYRKLPLTEMACPLGFFDAYRKNE